MELAIRSMMALSGQDVDSVVASSDCEKQQGVSVPVEMASDRNDAFDKFSLTAETRGYSIDEVKDFLVLRTHADRKLHTHHNKNFQLFFIFS